MNFIQQPNQTKTLLFTERLKWVIKFHFIFYTPDHILGNYILCLLVLELRDQWRVDVVMSVRPSSSTGVLFALVSNSTVPLSVSVLTRGPDEAVRLLQQPLTHTHTHFKHGWISVLTLTHLVPTGPAGFPGRRPGRHTHFVTVVLSRQLDGANKRVGRGASDFG